jgi:hypothetical protein
MEMHQKQAHGKNPRACLAHSYILFNFSFRINHCGCGLSAGREFCSVAPDSLPHFMRLFPDCKKSMQGKARLF